MAEQPNPNNKPVQTNGKVSQAKRGFFESDAKDIGSWILDSLIIPSVKEFVDRLISGSVHKALYGNPGDGRRNWNGRVDYNGNYVPSSSHPTYSDYQSISSGNNRRDDRPSGNTSNYGVIDFESREDISNLLDWMDEIIDRYDHVSVSAVYEHLGLKSIFTMENYCWKSTADAEVKITNSGFRLVLPRPTQIDSRR